MRKSVLRMLSILLSISMILPAVPVLPWTSVFAEETQGSASAEGVRRTEDGKWDCVLSADGAELVAYLGTAADVNVPQKVAVDGTSYSVWKLGDRLFYDNDSVNSVTLSEGVTAIGAEAFFDADNLVCIVTRESLATIGAKAFSGCDTFNSVILYDTVTSIGADAFADCPLLTVWCNEGTAAHSYAVSGGIPFRVLNPDASPVTVVENGISYYILNGEAHAIECDNAVTDVVIPVTVQGYPVASVKNIFSAKTNLVSVEILPQITQVYESMFKGCSSLTTVKLPDSVTSIGNQAFYQCQKLVNFEIPPAVTSIGTYAFYQCKALQSVTVPAGVRSLGAYTFYQCKALQEAKLPSEMTSIGTYAFYGCSALQEMVLPQKVTILNSYVFYACSALQEIRLPQGLRTIGERAFESCKALQSVSIPDSVTTIREAAFSFCSALESLTLPGNATLAENSFSSTGALKKVIISEGSTTVKDCGFGKSVTEVVLPETLETIPAGVFDGCSALEKVVIPASVTSMHAESFHFTTILMVYDGSYAHSFAVDNDLLHFVIGSGAEPRRVEQGGITYFLANERAVAIAYDPAVSSVVIPKTVEDCAVVAVKSIFTNATRLTSVEILAEITEIDDKTFQGCRMLKTVSLPDSVTAIGNYAFTSCTNLETVEALSGVKTLGSRAFYSCKALKSVSIPAATSVGEYCFSGCTGMETLTLPGSMTVGEYAFRDCTALKKLIIAEGSTTVRKYEGTETITELVLPSTAQRVSGYSDCSRLKTVVIPKSVKALTGATFHKSTIWMVYENSYAHTYAKDQTNILYFVINGEAQPSFYEQGGISYYLQDGNAYAVGYDGVTPQVVIPATVRDLPVVSVPVSFEGEKNLTGIEIRAEITSTVSRQFYGCEALETVTLPETLKTISTEAFYQCRALKKITLPASVRNLGTYAFYQCFALQEVVLPPEMTTLNSYVFHSCTALQEIRLPQGLRTIGERAFSTCRALQSVSIPNSVTAIGQYAFASCDALESATLPEGLQTIGERVFSNCRALKTIEIPGTVTTVGDFAFYNCSALENVTLNQGLKTLGEESFYGCKALKSIVIPDGVTTLRTKAFMNCTALESVTIPGSIGTVGADLFKGCSALKKVVISEESTRVRKYPGFGASVTELILPASVQTIGSGAFSDCSGLKRILIPETVTTLYPASFHNSTILLVHEDSYAHTFAKEKGLLYFVIHQAENPDVAFGSEISGTVRYTDNTPAAGAAVEILYDDGTVKERVTANSDGRYLISYAEVGTYTVRATDALGNTASSHVSVKRMNAFDVFLAGDTDLALKRGYSVSGTVNENGATVTLSRGSGAVITSVPATDGSFTIANVPNGTYVLRANGEKGSVSKEITVFGSDLSGIELIIDEAVGTLWGVTSVQERDGTVKTRNWVQVTAYNEAGVAVAVCKSDGDGKYVFEKMPLGNYVLAATYSEMRPDKNYGFLRTHTLTASAYAALTETSSFRADLVLREEATRLAAISGKVTVQGAPQKCDVLLETVSGSEIARLATASNGKYYFYNVPDGTYYITAVSQKAGMGQIVVSVRNGVVSGNTDIVIVKGDKVKNQEERFFSQVPELANADEAQAYRARIAEEKRLYDGLSAKEKKELSEEYVERLNRYVEWLANVSYAAESGVTVQQGGLVASAEEVENAADITYTVSVKKTEGHQVSTDGVQTEQDYIQHALEDAAGNQTIRQYYEITLTKTVNGKEQAITSVEKDTDTTGKFRITLEIPEEYRGYRHYNLLHEHHGEVTQLTDLDDDPNTITVEVDAFSTFALMATNRVLASDIALGDLDGVLGVGVEDAIYLLFHVNFPDRYPVDQDVDYDGSGSVDLDDAVYLLLHVNFPERYPLK